jgi:hypothetical protein
LAILISVGWPKSCSKNSTPNMINHSYSLGIDTKYKEKGFLQPEKQGLQHGTSIFVLHQVPSLIKNII